MEIFGIPALNLFVMVFIAFVIGLILVKIFKFALKTALLAGLVVLGLYLASVFLDIF